MAWTAVNSEGYVAPVALATDIVVLTVADKALRALTVGRSEGPRALPGGFIGHEEAPEQTARRKLREKTGLSDLYLEQLATFADPRRDPRGWIPSIAYLAPVPPGIAVPDASAGWIAARGDTPLEVELGLERAIPAEFMLHAHHWLILHGRYTCIARKPRCEVCLINDLCRWPEKTISSS